MYVHRQARAYSSWYPRPMVRPRHCITYLQKLALDRAAPVALFACRVEVVFQNHFLPFLASNPKYSMYKINLLVKNDPVVCR